MSNDSDTAEAKLTFEQAMARLDGIVRDLEDGRVGLADALERYERGVVLLKQCYALLEAAEQRIELLTGVDAEGRPITKPFEHVESTAAGDTGRARSRSRSTNRKEPPKNGADETPPRLF